MDKKPKPVGIAHRIEQMLEETRVITPGTQALLGFQFAAIFQDKFEKLSETLQQVHFISLLNILASVMFLMFSAAFHRIVEKGRDTERFHIIASIGLLLAMFFLALGIAFELFVVTQIIFLDNNLSYTISIASFLILTFMWFGVNFIVRKNNL